MLPPSSGWKSDCDLRNEEHDLAVGGARGGDKTKKWPLCCGKRGWGGNVIGKGCIATGKNGQP